MKAGACPYSASCCFLPSMSTPSPACCWFMRRRRATHMQNKQTQQPRDPKPIPPMLAAVTSVEPPMKLNPGAEGPSGLASASVVVATAAVVGASVCTSREVVVVVSVVVCSPPVLSMIFMPSDDMSTGPVVTVFTSGTDLTESTKIPGKVVFCCSFRAIGAAETPPGTAIVTSNFTEPGDNLVVTNSTGTPAASAKILLTDLGMPSFTSRTSSTHSYCKPSSTNSTIATPKVVVVVEVAVCDVEVLVSVWVVVVDVAVDVTVVLLVTVRVVEVAVLVVVVVAVVVLVVVFDVLVKVLVVVVNVRVTVVMVLVDDVLVVLVMVLEVVVEVEVVVDEVNVVVVVENEQMLHEASHFSL
mmetsp:Transcript_118303/g.342014  ORF Transcript_118303/g.342014 Transcript_118303/m.342014 type:complete len:356 (+) Transcript_118303:271-1338(+)